MATFGLNDGLVIVNSVTLSDHANSITTTDDRNQLDATTFGAGAQIFRKGLGTASIEVNFFNDFVGGSVYATLQPLIASTTVFQVEVRPTSAGRSATNPGIVLSQALLFTFSPLSGTVGEMVGLTATFVNAGSAGMTYLVA
jgi:hypothetical protein